MCNDLIIRCLGNTFMRNKSHVQASLLLFLSMQNRVVLLSLVKPCSSYKTLIINVLNIIYGFGFAIKSMYLCIAKDPYCGRFEVRYSTHGYANPVRDAAGTRGIIGTGW